MGGGGEEKTESVLRRAIKQRNKYDEIMGDCSGADDHISLPVVYCDALNLLFNCSVDCHVEQGIEYS